MLMRLQRLLGTSWARGLWAALLSVAALAGCRGIEVSSEVHATLEPASWGSFAWAEHSGTEDSVLDAEVRSAITRQFEDLGIELVDTGEADLVVSYDTLIETRRRNNDPYFDFWAVERYELGTLSIWVTNPASGAILWSGSGTSEIRISEVLVGPFATELTPTEYPRDWQVDEKVPAILAELERLVAASR